MYRNVILFCFVVLLGSNKALAQEKPVAEIFCGAELNYADVNFTRLYNVLVNMTPGAKVRLGKEWEVAAQVFVPVVNYGYANRLNMTRLNIADVSKVLRFERARQYFKISAGLFSKERYGGDLRWMYPVNSWLLFHARFGLTSHWVLGTDFRNDSECEFQRDNFVFTGMLGASIWLNPWATELRATGGRYYNKDYGVEGEIIRHFKHCSVSIFAQYHEPAPEVYSAAYTHRYSGGFRIVMMIPPYKKSKRSIVFRPASNFRLTYNAQADGWSMRKYNTDPEENERTYPIDIPWGTSLFNE